MCVVLVYFLTLHMIFDAIKVARAQTKKQSDITLGRNYPSTDTVCFKNSLYEFVSALFVQLLHYFGFTIQLVMLRDLT